MKGLGMGHGIGNTTAGSLFWGGGVVVAMAWRIVSGVCNGKRRVAVT